MADLPDTMVDLPVTMVDLPNTMVDLPYTMTVLTILLPVFFLSFDFLTGFCLVLTILTIFDRIDLT